MAMLFCGRIIFKGGVDLVAIPDVSRLYTHEEYMSFEYINENPRFELINGQLHLAEVPNTAHQTISGNLAGVIWSFI